MVPLHCTAPWTAACFSPEDYSVAIVMTNSKTTSSRQRLRLPAFLPQGRASEVRRLQAVLTQPSSGRFFVPHEAEAQEAAGCLEVRVQVPPLSICSLVVPDVSLHGGRSRVKYGKADSFILGSSPTAKQAKGKMRKHSHEPSTGVTMGMISALARATADGAALERCLGEVDRQTVAAWCRWQHECTCVAIALGNSLPAAPRADSVFHDLLEAVGSAAWGAANERKFGPQEADTKQAWLRFWHYADRLVKAAGLSETASQELKWYIFNTSWMMINLRTYGSDSSDHKEASARANGHFANLGGAGTVILRRGL